jgi:hypothetical protein
MESFRRKRRQTAARVKNPGVTGKIQKKLEILEMLWYNFGRWHVWPEKLSKNRAAAKMKP